MRSAAIRACCARRASTRGACASRCSSSWRFFTAAGMIVMLGRLGAAAPTAGFGLELDAIVAVIIGGASFRGGTGRLRDTAVGVLVPRHPQQRAFRPADGRRAVLPDQGRRDPAGADACGRWRRRISRGGRRRDDRLPSDRLRTHALRRRLRPRRCLRRRPKPERAAQAPADGSPSPAAAALRRQNGSRRSAGCRRSASRSRSRGVPIPTRTAAAKAAALCGAPAFAEARRPARRGAAGPAARAGIATQSHVPLAPRGDRGRRRLPGREAAGARSPPRPRRSCASRKSRGVLLAAVANKRFSPPYALAKALIDAGALKSRAHGLHRQVHPRLSLCRPARRRARCICST